MQIIEPKDYSLIHGGEVGATGMGDDYHYTGKPPLDENFVECTGGLSGHTGGSFTACGVIIIRYIQDLLQ